MAVVAMATCMLRMVVPLSSTMAARSLSRRKTEPRARSVRRSSVPAGANAARAGSEAQRMSENGRSSRPRNAGQTTSSARSVSRSEQNGARFLFPRLQRAPYNVRPARSASSPAGEARAGRSLPGPGVLKFPEADWRRRTTGIGTGARTRRSRKGNGDAWGGRGDLSLSRKGGGVAPSTWSISKLVPTQARSPPQWSPSFEGWPALLRWLECGRGFTPRLYRSERASRGIKPLPHFRAHTIPGIMLADLFPGARLGARAALFSSTFMQVPRQDRRTFGRQSRLDCFVRPGELRLVIPRPFDFGSRHRTENRRVGTSRGRARPIAA